MNRPVMLHRPVHIINFDIIDSPEEAMIGARSILALVQQIVSIAEEKGGSLESEIERLIEEVQAKNTAIPMLYAVQFY